MSHSRMEVAMAKVAPKGKKRARRMPIQLMGRLRSARPIVRLPVPVIVGTYWHDGRQCTRTSPNPLCPGNQHGFLVNCVPHLEIYKTSNLGDVTHQEGWDCTHIAYGYPSNPRFKGRRQRGR